MEQRSVKSSQLPDALTQIPDEEPKMAAALIAAWLDLSAKAKGPSLLPCHSALSLFFLIKNKNKKPYPPNTVFFFERLLLWFTPT